MIGDIDHNNPAEWITAHEQQVKKLCCLLSSPACFAIFLPVDKYKKIREYLFPTSQNMELQFCHIRYKQYIHTLPKHTELYMVTVYIYFFLSNSKVHYLVYSRMNTASLVMLVVVKVNFHLGHYYYYYFVLSNFDWAWLNLKAAAIRLLPSATRSIIFNKKILLRCTSSILQSRLHTTKTIIYHPHHEICRDKWKTSTSLRPSSSR